MLSNTCKYAIRAVIYLAVHADKTEKIGIKRIAEDLEIPMPFLGKILQNLAKNKILSSTKGPHGGFGIGKALNEVSLHDIVEIIDGTDAFEFCVIGLRTCNELNEQAVHCSLHEAYLPIRENLRNIFRNTSIQSLAQGIKEGKQKINI